MNYTRDFQEFLDTGFTTNEDLDNMVWRIAEDVGIFTAIKEGRVDLNLIYKSPDISISEMSIGDVEALEELVQDANSKKFE